MTNHKFLRDEVAPLSKLKPNPKNPRKHSEDYIKRIERSIAAFETTNPIIVTPDYTIVAGHARLIAAKNMGLTEFPVRVFDFTPEEAEAYMIADNKLAEGSEWIDSILVDLFSDLELKQFDVVLTGYDMSEISALRDLTSVEPVEDDFDVGEALEETESRAKRCDVWRLGRHRVMCGDSTKADDVTELMDGNKAEMVYTDPPYGVDLDTDFSKLKGTAKSPNAKGYKYNPVVGDNKSFDFTPFLNLDVTEQFWFGADYYANQLPNNGSWFVWIKRNDADSEMIGNDFELCWSKARHKKQAIRIRWVGWAATEAAERRQHPTQKPIELAIWFIKKFGRKIVLDLFGGSGSTLIACEQIGRTCYMMEIDPHYCDVILKRWEDYTGQQAEVVSRDP